MKTIFETDPSLSDSAFGWNPKEVESKSSKRLNWICPKGHVWMASLADRRRGQNCAVCASKKILIGFNDLATTHPEIARQAYGWDPTTVFSGSNKDFKWRCNLGHEWTAKVLNRTRRNDGCPICSGRTVLEGFNDLATTHPEIARQANGWNPADYSKGSNYKVSWICDLNHIWVTSIAIRTSQLTSCPFCSGNKVLAGFNDLATTHPEIAAQANGWDSKSVSAGSHSKKAWICIKGHKWTASVHSRAGLNTNCPICANKKLLKGFNDLATTHPEIAKQANGWNPEEIIAGTNRKFNWKCDEGHEWVATANKRIAGRGCPVCAKTGFSPDKEAWVYLLRHDLWGLLQIGISNSPKDRLSIHKRLNWELIDLKGPMIGSKAYEIEQNSLKFLKSSGAKFDAAKIEGKFTGFTESWLEDSFPVKKINELISASSR